MHIYFLLIRSVYVLCARARAQFFTAAAGAACALNFAVAAGASAPRRAKTHELRAANAFFSAPCVARLLETL